MDLGGVNTMAENISTVDELNRLTVKELNYLLKVNKLPVKGKKPQKVSALAQKLGLQLEETGPEGEFQKVVNIIKQTEDGWTKTLPKLTGVDLEQVTSYLLGSHHVKLPTDDRDSLGNGAFEVYTPANMRRYKTLRSYEHYRSGHIHSLRYHNISEDSRYCALRCKCNPSWDTSGVMYTCIVIFYKETGHPVGSHCSCVAGLGQACTHAAALLFAFEDMTSLGLTELPPDAACTEIPCQWTDPKGTSVNPLPLREVDISNRAPTKAPSIKKTRIREHNPVNPKKRKVNAEDVAKLQHSLNLILPTLPWLTIAEPMKWDENYAEPEIPIGAPTLESAYSEDSSILQPAYEECVVTTPPVPATLMERANIFLSRQSSLESADWSVLAPTFVESLVLSNEEVSSINKVTVGQSDNQKWFSHREGMITGSRIHDVYRKMVNIDKGKENVKTENVVHDILGTGTFKGNRATAYGVAHENIAANEYAKQEGQKHHNMKLSMCGIHVSDSHSFMGGSCDRIRTCDCHEPCVVEIKCPKTLDGSRPEISISDLEFVKKDCDDKYQLNKKHSYYTQMQMYLALTSCSSGVFIVWSPSEMVCIDVSFDPEYWASVLSHTSRFYAIYVAPAVLEKVASTRCTMDNIQNEFVQAQTTTSFVQGHTCAVCHGILKEPEQIHSNSAEASIQCECKCKCSKWFHWGCVHYNENDLMDGEEAAEWYCPNCVRNCDIYY